MSEIKISIIIPVYNVETFIGSCLMSVRNQTLTDIEILCINDNSSDGSLAILKKHQAVDSRIIVENIENSGPGKARNRGLELATGTYIAFLDGDDEIRSTALETMYNAATRHKCDICIGFPDCIDHNTSQSVRSQYFEIAKKQILPNKKTTVFEESEIACILPHVPVVPWNKIYLRSAVCRSKARFAENMMHEDFLFYFQSMQNAKRVVVMPDQLYRYRVNRPGSITQSPTIRYFRDIPKIFEQLENETNMSDSFRKSYLHFKATHLILWINGIIMNSYIPKNEVKTLFQYATDFFKSTSVPSSFNFIDKTQFFLIKHNLLNLFKFKVFSDKLKHTILP